MANKHPEFIYSSCVSCGICAQACPVSCIDMGHARKQGKYMKPCPTLADLSACIGCGMCERSCPMDAIAMKEEQNS